MEKRIYYVEWKYFGDKEVHRHIFRDLTWKDVFLYAQISRQNMVEFSFEDITDQNIEDFERRVNPDGV